MTLDPNSPLRARPAWLWAASTVAAVALFAVGSPLAATVYDVPVVAAIVVGLLQAAAVPMALAFPRVAIAAWVIGQSLLAITGTAGQAPWPVSVTGILTLCCLLAIVGVREPWRVGAVAWALGFLVPLQIVFYAGKTTAFDSSLADFVTATSVSALVLVAAVLVARTAGFRSELDHERTVTATEQERRVVVEERNRIARELHDVVAHGMSIIQVQATSAPYRLPGMDDATRAEFSEIATTARAALVEMRTLLGVLRSEDSGTSLAPQPGLGELPDLLAALSRSGVTVDATVEDGLPDGTPTGRAVYRIAQESLSNAVRHAPGARVRLSVARSRGLLVLIVENGPSTRPDPSGSGILGAPAERTLPSGGHGLIGMRERAAALGGSVTAGATPEGGFRVRALLPLDGEATPEPARPEPGKAGNDQPDTDETD